MTLNRDRRMKRSLFAYAGLLFLFFLIFILNIQMGNVEIPFRRIIPILSGGDPGSKEYVIIHTIRLPRIIMAAVLGGGLALSGLLLQTFFGNPIAGPFVLGISSGAKLFMALTLILFLRIMPSLSSLFLILASFAGSLLATGFIILCSRKVRDNSSLLVAGIMTGYICSAATDFILNFAEESEIANLHGWSLGSFSGSSWRDVWISLIIVGTASLSTFLLSKPLGAFLLGEAYAESMGVNVRLFRYLIIILSSILSACVTAFAGPVSFVGIAVPFLVRNLTGVSKPSVIIPLTFLSGSVFVMLCDLIARCAFSPSELSISTVTGLLGAPVVIFMMIGRKRGRRLK